MLRMRIEARRGLRWGLLSLAATMALTAVSADPADARGRRHKRTAATSSYNPPYAAIVVDANSGKVLHSASADKLRHPASLTKVMTLYMLFERLEAGKLTLESRLRVSDHASKQPPTKLGLREGSTISVEDAIKGMITRSANDAAVVVAENLADSEDEFAREMTRKARALGMSKTVYRNASGLPDSEQVTTARDQATLGRAIQERFPRHYRYFSIRSFTFRGKRIGNHNRLLGRVEGVDGIKTGYIRSSGFNLLTSLHRKGRYVVAVVLGGKSSGARDARMRQLLAKHVDDASTRRTAPMIAEAPSRDAQSSRTARSGSTVADRFALASAGSVPVPTPRNAPVAGSTEPIRPVAVRTVSVKPGSIKGRKAARAEGPPPAPVRAGLLGVLPARTASVNGAEQETSAIPSSRPQTNSDWVIQVGAYPERSEAHERLATVQSKAARLLSSASPFTETVQKGDTTLYRARFAGLERAEAEAACKFLRRKDVDCLAIRN